MCSRSHSHCEIARPNERASLSAHPADHPHGNNTPADPSSTLIGTTLTSMSQGGRVTSTGEKGAAADQDRKYRAILDSLLRKSYHAGYSDALASDKALASAQTEDAAIAAVLAPVGGGALRNDAATSATGTSPPSGQFGQWSGILPGSPWAFAPVVLLGVAVFAVSGYPRARRYVQVMKELEARGMKPDVWITRHVAELSRLPPVPAWMTESPVPKTWVQASRRMREHEQEPEMAKKTWADKALIKSVVLQGGLHRIPRSPRRLLAGSRWHVSDNKAALGAPYLRSTAPVDPAEDLTEDPADAEHNLEIWRLCEQLREAQEALEVLRKVGVEHPAERAHASGSVPVDAKTVAEGIRQAVDKVEKMERMEATFDTYTESAPSAAPAPSVAVPTQPILSAQRTKEFQQPVRTPPVPEVPTGEEVTPLEARHTAVGDTKTSRDHDDVVGATPANPTSETAPAPTPTPTAGLSGESRLRPFLPAPQASPSLGLPPLIPQIPLGEDVMSMEALRKAVEGIKASYEPDDIVGAAAANLTSETAPTPTPTPTVGLSGESRLRPFLRAPQASPSLGLPPLTPQIPLGEEVMSMEALRKAVEDVRKGYVEDENKRKAVKSNQGKTEVSLEDSSGEMREGPLSCSMLMSLGMQELEEGPRPVLDLTKPAVGTPKPAAPASTTIPTTTKPAYDKTSTIEVRRAKSSRYYFCLCPVFLPQPAGVPPSRGSIDHGKASAPMYGPEVVERLTLIKRCAPEDVARGVWDDLQRAGLKVPGRQAKGRVASIDDVSVWELNLPIRPTADGCRALVRIDGQWWESRVVKKLKGVNSDKGAVWLWTLGN